MSSLNLEQFSTHLQQLNFNLLFTDVLGWNHPPASERVWQEDEAKDIRYQRRMVAELSGVAVLEIITETGWSDETQRMAIWRQVSQSHYENLLIFLDRAEQPTQSLWYWVKRTKDAETGKPKNIPRRHEYFRGQPVDLFADDELECAIEDIYARLLLESAADTLNRLMRSGVNDEQLSDAVRSLREENQLTYAEDDAAQHEPKIVCSMGLIGK